MTVPRLVALGITLVLIPDTALAHTPIEGIGDFYNGVLHPWLVPAHLLALLGLGLWLGQRELPHSQTAFPVFALALLTGLGGAGLGVAPPPAAAMLILPALAGLLVAAAPKLSRSSSVLLALGAGLTVGLDSAPDTVLLRARIMTLLGTALGASAGLLYVTGLAQYFQRHWQGIGVRILGSWTAASALLVLALAAAGKE